MHIKPGHQHVEVLVEIRALCHYCDCKLANQNVRPDSLLVGGLVVDLEVLFFCRKAASFKNSLIFVAE
jgi:hypothetical protein